MATAAEKEAKAQLKAVERAEFVAGRGRLASMPRGEAFPQPRLRSAGDLSRYAIGAFADDPMARPVPAKPAPVKPKAKVAAKKPVAKKVAPKPKPRATVKPKPKAKPIDSELIRERNRYLYTPPRPTPIDQAELLRERARYGATSGGAGGRF